MSPPVCMKLRKFYLCIIFINNSYCNIYFNLASDNNFIFSFNFDYHTVSYANFIKHVSVHAVQF